MTDTLVLNATFQPLSVVSYARALALIQIGKAVVEHADETRLLRSPSASFPRPLVIRLLRYVRVPHRVAPFSRRAVLVRDDFTCQYDACTRPGHTIDHVVPVSRGGAARDYRNAVASCSVHNNRKADRTPAEAGLRLRREPREPTVGDLLVAAIDPQARSWLSELGLYDPPAARAPA